MLTYLRKDAQDWTLKTIKWKKLFFDCTLVYRNLHEFSFAGTDNYKFYFNKIKNIISKKLKVFIDA